MDGPVGRAVRSLVRSFFWGENLPVVSDGADGVGLGPAIALGYLELDALALFEGAISVHLDCGVVDEDVTSAVDRDEAVAFVRVEPLDCALRHSEPAVDVSG